MYTYMLLATFWLGKYGGMEAAGPELEGRPLRRPVM
jgi:hypothetical protein